MKTDVAKVTYPVIRSRVLALLELLSTAIKNNTEWESETWQEQSGCSDICRYTQNATQT